MTGDGGRGGGEGWREGLGEIVGGGGRRWEAVGGGGRRWEVGGGGGTWIGTSGKSQSVLPAASRSPLSLMAATKLSAPASSTLPSSPVAATWSLSSTSISSSGSAVSSSAISTTASLFCALAWVTSLSGTSKADSAPGGGGKGLERRQEVAGEVGEVVGKMAGGGGRRWEEAVGRGSWVLWVQASAPLAKTSRPKLPRATQGSPELTRAA